MAEHEAERQRREEEDRRKKESEARYRELEALRAEPQHIAGTEVVIMTNFDQDESTRLALQTSVDSYLIKAGITPRRLLEIIAGMKKS